MERGFSFALNSILMTIALGSDHAGYELKAKFITYLESAGYNTLNFGTDTGESTDYPDHAHPTALAVEQGKADLGVLICGSGNGISMTANKHQNVRCALCWLPEIATLARQHNDANICAIPARFVSSDEAIQILKAFLDAQFEGGRHQRRVSKIAC